MNDGLSQIKETTAYRRARSLFGVVLAIISFLGFASISADIEAWQRWLGGIESWIPYALAYSILLLLALALLAPDLSTWRARRSRASDAESAEEEIGRQPTKKKIAVTAPDPAPKPQPREQKLSDLLQAQLDEGVRLRKSIPPVPGLPNLLRPETTREDVRNWIRRTGGLLNGEPELKSEFNYTPRRAPFEGLVPPHPFEPQHKKCLDQRIANLGEIISDLREQGR